MIFFDLYDLESPESGRPACSFKSLLQVYSVFNKKWAGDPYYVYGAKWISRFFGLVDFFLGEQAGVGCGQHVFHPKHGCGATASLIRLITLQGIHGLKTNPTLRSNLSSISATSPGPSTPMTSEIHSFP